MRNLGFRRLLHRFTAQGGAGLLVSGGDAADNLQREIARRLFARPDFVRVYGKAGEDRLLPSKSSTSAKAIEALAARAFIECQESPNGLACRLTPAGRQWVLENDHPNDLLGDALRISERQAERLEQMAQDLAVLRVELTAATEQLRTLVQAARDDVKRRAVVGALIDGRSIAKWPTLTLADLFEKLRIQGVVATIGEFHDIVRTMHAAGTIRLAPWTGPLYGLPEPSLALLVGHEVLYYVELQQSAAA